LGLRDLLGLLVLTVVDGFVFCGWDVAERAVQAALVPPLDPCQGGQLDLFGGPPGAVAADPLRLVQPVDRLGERVVVAVTLEPTEATAPSSARRWVERTARYCPPRSR
jgi:hypothetical protein